MPFETERRFLIKIPSPQFLEKCEHLNITQIYLESDSGVTHRVRRIVSPLGVSYTETRKTRISAISCIEDESEISESRFAELSQNIRQGSRPIIKTRYMLPYISHTLEIDVYPEWSKIAILEIELTQEDEKLEIPDGVELVREISGDKRFSNSSLSERFANEDDYL